MPQYKVIKPGFYNGKMYDPDGKRPVLVTDKPFPKDKTPSWVLPMKGRSQSAAEKEAAENEVAEAKKQKEEAVKAEREAVERASTTKVDFTDSTPGEASSVETL